jgi:hypothetical protein
MEAWISQNNPRAQTALALGCIVVGLVLVIGFRGFQGFAMTNAPAGFLLGILLLVSGVAALMLRGKQTVVVDPRKRLITVEDVTHFGTKKREIPFGEIDRVGIGYLGKKSNYVSFYYLALWLHSGEQYPLFTPGRFFRGASDRAVVESWRQRLESYLGGPALLR